MSDQEFNKGLERGKTGKSSAHSLFDLNESRESKKSREAGYRAGASAKANADAIRGGKLSQSSSLGSGRDGLIDKIADVTWWLGGLVGLLGGIYWGIALGGVGKAIILGIILGIVGVVVGFLLPYLGVFAIFMVLIIVGFGGTIWLLRTLWNL